MEATIKTIVVSGGRKNTKYFHATCNRRKHNNHTQRLKNEAEDWVDWNCGMKDMINEYFQKMFTEEQNQGEEVLSCISKQIFEQ